MKGTVKKKTDRGFGFIAVEGQEKDLFFHSTALSGVTFDELSEGATVTFDVQDGGDGRQSAKNVMLAGQDAPSEPNETAAESAPAEETAMAESAPASEEESAEEAPKA